MAEIEDHQEKGADDNKARYFLKIFSHFIHTQQDELCCFSLTIFEVAIISTELKM